MALLVERRTLKSARPIHSNCVSNMYFALEREYFAMLIIKKKKLAKLFDPGKPNVRSFTLQLKITI